MLRLCPAGMEKEEEDACSLQNAGSVFLQASPLHALEHEKLSADSRFSTRTQNLDA